VHGGKLEKETQPCKLEKACPGIEGAAPVIVEMTMSGDGLWDWVNENTEKFKSSMTTDIANTLYVSENKSSDVKAALAAALLLQAAPALLADQTVDVSFSIASGASTTLTPTQLAQAYERAVKNGTANFSSTEASGCPSFKVTVTGTGQAAVVLGQGTTGVIMLAAILLLGTCCLVAAVCLLKKMCCKSSDRKTTPNKDGTYAEKKLSAKGGHPDDTSSEEEDSSEEDSSED
jgi:hypothetical protein